MDGAELLRARFGIDLPGVSVPCGFTASGLPIGLQILGAPFEEEKLLRVARMHEKATDWHTRRASGSVG